MSRRGVQSPTPFKHGNWWVVRVRFDVPGQEARVQKTLRVAPVSARLSKPQLELKAQEVIVASGACSPERFNQVVLGELTFRDQAKVYLRECVRRNRRPIRNTTSIEGALRKHILPLIGDLPLSMIDNLSVKPLVEKLCKAKLSPRTVEKYTLYVKQIVASKLAPNGEPLYPRKWNSEALDLPIVVYSKQKRPSQKVEGVNALIASAKSDEQRYLFVLLAATGMRISEGLALEAKHFVNGGRTIVVEQQVDKDNPQIIPHLKTDASYRQVDLHPDVAAYLQKFVAGKSGLILHTANNTPYLYGNLAEDWLDPLLTKLRLYEAGMGWHSFKRFRNSWLRDPDQGCQEDLRKFWLAHKPREMGEVYSALKENVPARLKEAERVGHGFTLPQQPKLEVVPNVPKIWRKKTGTK